MFFSKVFQRKCNSTTLFLVKAFEIHFFIRITVLTFSVSQYCPNDQLPSRRVSDSFSQRRSNRPTCGLVSNVIFFDLVQRVFLQRHSVTRFYATSLTSSAAWMLIFAALLPTATPLWTVRPQTSVFYADDRASVSYLGAYFGYTVISAGEPAASYFVSLGDFVGGKVSLASAQTPVFELGLIQSGANATFFAYFTTPTSSDGTPATAFTAKIWTARFTIRADFLWQCW